MTPTINDLENGYYLLFIDGGIRADGEGRKQGAIGVILQAPDCGEVLLELLEKVGPVDSPTEAEYLALLRGLKLAAEERLPYVAVFSDSQQVVNQVMRRWNMNERASELCEEAREAFNSFEGWQLSWVPREMNGNADKLVGRAFNAEP